MLLVSVNIDVYSCLSIQATPCLNNNVPILHVHGKEIVSFSCAYRFIQIFGFSEVESSRVRHVISNFSKTTRFEPI